MPQQVLSSVENNFTKGLITEATGLNFPENAATSASNCVFTLVGDVTRREGINNELNGTTFNADRTNKAMSSYVWNNPGGDGNSKLLVKQIGNILYFYNIAASTVASPLSTQLDNPTLSGKTIDISLSTVVNGIFDQTAQCQYADGNGYLFVYHPSCESTYVTYNPNTQAFGQAPITIQIRDFQGLPEQQGLSIRPNTLTTEHNYNLGNQGWTTGNSWFTTYPTALNPNTGVFNITVATGLSISNGDLMTMTATDNLYAFPQGTIVNSGTATMSGTVTSYTTATGALTLNITSSSINSGFAFNNYGGDGVTQIFYSFQFYAINFPWQISSINKGLINTWHTAEGNYPSNSDVWYLFKNSTGVFDPANVQPNQNILLGQAPQGHYVLPAFKLDRNLVSSLSGITVVSTPNRPTTGAWHAGRVWYTGATGFQTAMGDAGFYTWTENIYFSQVIQQNATNFGFCYQVNDPTSDKLNALLPTDGGVITIVGSGTIHKLFPLANGMLVFANNGIWFISGSQGIGFSASDYTITKISSVKVLSAFSFVDVLGLPYFWNEEGIYQVKQATNGQLSVEPITVGTILSFYNTIPLASKKFARGSYDPIDYTIQWCFRSTIETGVTDRYQFDSILNFNNYNRAFFPYLLSTGTNTQFIHGVDYISYLFTGNLNAPIPGFKYHCSRFANGVYQHGIAEEYDTTFVDWGTANFTSSFTTGFKLHGQAIHRFQTPYIYTFSRMNGSYAAFYIQGVWDYASNFDSNKLTMPQFIELFDINSGMLKRRHRIRGRGTVLQLQFTSVPNQPFDLMGWALYENTNTGV